MQFFIDSQGTVVNLISSPVYQGSTNACELVLVAPFSSANQITACFKLPNGIITTERIMSVQDQPMQIEGKTYNVWRVLLDGAITEYAGKVSVWFSIYQGNPNGELPIISTTYESTFNVTKGGTPAPTNPPPTNDGYNIYRAILQYLTQINPQFDVESISYTAPSGFLINTDETVTDLEPIPDTVKERPTDADPPGDMKPGVNFSIANIDGSTGSPLYALGIYLNKDTGFTMTFANPTEIGKMQITFERIFDSVLLKVIADKGLETEEEITSFRVQSASPVNTIVAVNKTVKSISIVQPWTDNVDFDKAYSPIVNKGYTNGRFYVKKILMYAPNTEGQITITSSTGRTIVFPDTDAEKYRDDAFKFSNQAETFKNQAEQYSESAQSSLEEIERKAGQEGGYPILQNIGGKPMIPSVYINLVDTTIFENIEEESDLNTLVAPVGAVARLVVTNEDNTKTVVKSFVKLDGDTGIEHWALYSTSYADNCSNSLYAQESYNALRVNGLAINGLIGEEEYNALQSKVGVYFVQIEPSEE